MSHSLPKIIERNPAVRLENIGPKITVTLKKDANNKYSSQSELSQLMKKKLPKKVTYTKSQIDEMLQFNSADSTPPEVRIQSDNESEDEEMTTDNSTSNAVDKQVEYEDVLVPLNDEIDNQILTSDPIRPTTGPVRVNLLPQLVPIGNNQTVTVAPILKSILKATPSTSVQSTHTDNGRSVIVEANVHAAPSTESGQPSASTGTTMHIPRGAEVTLRNGKAHVSQPVNTLPNIQDRVDRVLKLLSEKPLSFTTTEISVLNDFPISTYRREAAEIVKKLVQQQPITRAEAVKLQQIKGFYFYDVLRTVSACDRATATMIMHKTPEYAKYMLGQEHFPTICNVCKVGHEDAQGNCNHLYHFGSHLLRALEITVSWRHQVKAVFITHTQLVSLPHSMYSEVLNLNIPVGLDYDVTSQSAYETVTNSPLYQCLDTILTAIRYETKLPVFIEYVANSAPVPTHLHLLGFFKICKSIQKKYQGLIIAVLGTVIPIAGETPDSFIYKKAKSRREYMCALAMAQAMGVPLLIMDILDLDPSHLFFRVRQPGWKDESIFNALGQPTKEFFNRISILLKSRIELLSRFGQTEKTALLGRKLLHDGHGLPA